MSDLSSFNFKDGSLRIIRNGIGIEEKASVDFHGNSIFEASVYFWNLGVKSIYSLSTKSDSIDDHLIISGIDGTHVLRIEGEELEESEDGFGNLFWCSSIITSKDLKQMNEPYALPVSRIIVFCRFLNIWLLFILLSGDSISCTCDKAKCKHFTLEFWSWRTECMRRESSCRKGIKKRYIFCLVSFGLGTCGFWALSSLFISIKHGNRFD